MWQSPSVSLGSDMPRWKEGCELLNSDWEFRFYYDEDLIAFAKNEYPQYLPLFEYLTGVYMADMARVLLVYHYGGLYMDMDFYCHRPFDCLIHQILATELSTYQRKDLLVVSREPQMHAHLFRNKDRVVIQDFFLTTPKHPFFKWLLDDKLDKFLKDEELLRSNGLGSRSEGELDEVELNMHKNISEKMAMKNDGPFSYSIERDIDRYRSIEIRNLHANSSLSELVDVEFFSTAGGIFELPAGVLHPLVDTTNLKLYTNCKDLENKPDEVEHVCEEVAARHFFSPIPETIAVHMWTHVYLGWSFLRSSSLSTLYNHVEHVVPPTMECPKLKKEYFPHADGVNWMMDAPAPLINLPSKNRSNNDSTA